MVSAPGVEQELSQFSSPELLEVNHEAAIRTSVQHLHTQGDHVFHKYLKFTRFSVRWMEEKEINKINTRTNLHNTLTMALIPFDDASGRQWSIIVYGLEWHIQWYYVRPKATEDRKIFLIDEVLRNYLKLTLSIGGIPALPFSDADANSGWLFFGPYESLNLIHTQLKEVATAYTQDEFERYYRRLEPALTH